MRKLYRFFNLPIQLTGMIFLTAITADTLALNAWCQHSGGKPYNNPNWAVVGNTTYHRLAICAETGGGNCMWVLCNPKSSTKCSTAGDSQFHEHSGCGSCSRDIDQKWDAVMHPPYKNPSFKEACPSGHVEYYKDSPSNSSRITDNPKAKVTNHSEPWGSFTGGKPGWQRP